MDEDRLRNLMESPLEETGRVPRRERRKADKTASAEPADRRESNPSSGRTWGPFLAAMAIGGALSLGAFVIADSNDDPAPAPAAPAPSVTAAPPSEPAAGFGALPDGYHPLNDRVGARPERILLRDDAIFVSFTTAVRSELDPDETAGFVGGIWTAEMADGRRVTAIGEFTDPFARGAFTVGFEVDGAAAGDLVGLELSAEALRTGLTRMDRISIEDGLPWSGLPGQTRIPLDGELTFVIDAMDLTSESGRIEWHLEGSAEQVGAARAELELFGQGTFPAGFFLPANAASFLGFFGSATAPPDLARSGVIELEPLRVGRPSTVRTIDATWTIDWFAYVPAEVQIPLDGVQVVTVG